MITNLDHVTEHTVFTARVGTDEYVVSLVAEPPGEAAEHHFIAECGWSRKKFAKLHGVFFDALVRIARDPDLEDGTEDYLGACAYASVRDFYTGANAPDYFADMVREAAGQLTDQGAKAAILEALTIYLETQK